MNTKFILLAAGKGKRLRPYTDKCPKCMVQLAGRSLLDWQISTARSCGIKDIIVVKGYQAEKINKPDTKSYINEEFDSTNMVHTLWKAEKEFEDDIIISYTDIVYETSVLMALLKAPHEISVVVDKEWRAYWKKRFSDPVYDAESLKIDSKGHISDIGRPISSMSEPDAQYIGLMRFRGNGIKALRSVYETERGCHCTEAGENGLIRDFKNLYMTDLLQKIIDSGNVLHPVMIQRKWLEIDTVSDLKLSQIMVSNSNDTITINE